MHNLGNHKLLVLKEIPSFIDMKEAEIQRRIGPLLRSCKHPMEEYQEYRFLEFFCLVAFALYHSVRACLCVRV